MMSMTKDHVWLVIIEDNNLLYEERYRVFSHDQKTAALLYANKRCLFSNPYQHHFTDERVLPVVGAPYYYQSGSRYIRMMYAEVL